MYNEPHVKGVSMLCVTFTPILSLSPLSEGCAIAQESLQAQGTTVLADSISSDVNGILLMFSATL